VVELYLVMKTVIAGGVLMVTVQDWLVDDIHRRVSVLAVAILKAPKSTSLGWVNFKVWRPVCRDVGGLAEA